MKKALPSSIGIALLLLACVPKCVAQRQAIAESDVVNGFVVAIRVIDGGDGYTTAPGVTISGQSGSGAVAVAVVEDGSVSRVEVLSAGSGYTLSPAVQLGEPTILAEGLIAHLPFDNGPADISNSGFNAVVRGATRTPDRFGRADAAYRMNGVDQWLELAKELPDSDGLTVTMWIRAEDDRFGVLFADSAPFTSGRDTELNTNPGFQLAAAFTKGESTRPLGLHADGVLALNRWLHVALSFGPSGSKLLVNGRTVASETAQAQNIGWHTVPTLGVHNHGFGNDGWFKGAIDDVRIYDRSLPESRVLQILRWEAPPTPRLQIETKMVSVRMWLDVGKKYQLYSSRDLRSWSIEGQTFVATHPEVVMDFNVLDSGRYFQLEEVP